MSSSAWIDWSMVKRKLRISIFFAALHFASSLQAQSPPVDGIDSRVEVSNQPPGTTSIDERLRAVEERVRIAEARAKAAEERAVAAEKRALRAEAQLRTLGAKTKKRPATASTGINDATRRQLNEQLLRDTIRDVRPRN